MPFKPKVPCREPGCANLCEMGERYCAEHAKLHPSEFIDRRKKWEHEKSSGARGYDSRWQKARTSYLQSHPLCVECMKQGRYTKATVVDHIKPHKGDQKLFWDHDNWQSLCKPCHDRKTMSEDVRRTDKKPPAYAYPWRNK